MRLAHALTAAALAGAAGQALAQDGLLAAVDDSALSVMVYSAGAWQPLFSGVAPQGIAVDEATCTMYLSTGTTLYHWQLGDAAATLIGTITVNGSSAGAMTGLAWANGQLYAHRSTNSTAAPEGLYQIDTATAAATLVVALDQGTTMLDLGGLDFNPANGLFYSTNDDSDLRGLVTVDPATGVVSLVAAYPNGETDIDGLAIGNGVAYLIDDDNSSPGSGPGLFYSYDLSQGSGGTYGQLPSPWSSSEVFSGGAFALCFTAPPPPRGACCTVTGCEVMTEANCTVAGGRYAGDGTSCPEFQYSEVATGSVFEDISGTGIDAGLVCDDCGTTLPIGFAFNFYGTDYTDVGAASNGYLTFGATLTDFSNDAIPNTSNPNDVIAVLWDDLNLDPASGSTNPGHGNVYYATVGTAPNRQFIIQWNDVPQYNIADSNTFQAVLYEGSNRIELRYATITPEGTAGDYTVGVENSDGTEGLAISAAGLGGGNTARAIVGETVGQNPCEGQDCPADFDGNGSLTLNDFVSFRNAYVAGDLAADFDRNGSLSLNDFVTFRNEYVAGCP